MLWLLALTLGWPAAGVAQMGTISACGVIQVDTQWSAGTVYVINRCVVTVAAGATLTMEPGVIVKLEGSHDQMVVAGRLRVLGSLAAPVVITSLRDDTHGGDTNADAAATAPAKGDWGWILFNAGSRGDLQNAFIGYGGVGSHGYTAWAMVKTASTDVTLSGVTIEQSWATGLYAENASPAVYNSRFVDNGYNNAGYGLHYRGLDPTAPLIIQGSSFVATGGQAGFLELSGSMHGPIVVDGNHADGGTSGISVHGTLSGTLDWNSPGLPTVISGLTVAEGGNLILRAGSVAKFTGHHDQLVVHGSFRAEGTEQEPVALTSLRDDTHGGDTNADGAATVPAPGDWGWIVFNAGSHGDIRNAFVGYGGVGSSGYTEWAMVKSYGASELVLEDVTLVQSWAGGLYVANSGVLVRGTVANNAFGIHNGTPSKGVVDARRVWWGDPSGPLHRTKHPSGTGNEITDGVLFFPWAVDEEGTVPVQVLLAGPTTVSPGQTVEYAVSHHTDQAIRDAVLVLALPAGAEYIDGSAGAVFWPDRGEVFWKLGNLAAGDEGTRSARVRYVWGLPGGTVASPSAVLAGSDFGQNERDVDPYLHFEAPELVAATRLTPAELNAERQADASFDTLCRRALAAGFEYLGAAHVELAGRGPATLAFYQRSDRSHTVVARREGRAVSFTHSPVGRAIEDASGGVRFDSQTFRTEFWGSWSTDASERSVLDPAAPQAARCNEAICFRNCFAKKLANGVVGVGSTAAYTWWAGWVVAPVAVPLAGGALLAYETYEYFECGNQCAIDPSTHCCERDQWTPFTNYLFPRGCWHLTCVQVSQTWAPAAIPVNCLPGFRCIEGSGCKECPNSDDVFPRSVTRQIEVGTDHRNLSCRDTRVIVARDPNEKSGPVGDVLPGDEVSYTVEYENVGAGRAYGVYVVDQLCRELDERTLDLRGQGTFLPATRSILWEVGELAPKGEAGSKGQMTYNVRLDSGLPSGTVITNQAVVYFPSVPEETSTNTVVNVIQPLVAVPMEVETSYQQPIAMTLQGRDASGTPLTFAVRQPPGHGRLTGTPPNLTYTPVEGFTGQDHFTFVANNGVSESRAADVTVLVTPSAADTVAPEVVWTYPSDGALLSGVPTEPILTDSVYAPSVLAGFSEAMDPATLTADSFDVVDHLGRRVAASIVWDGTTRHAALWPREPWRPGGYTAVISTDVTDARGNAISAEVAWTFRVGALPTCVGDCSGDDAVTINELITMVNMALGTQPIGACLAGDKNGDGQLTIDEILVGVNAALNGCGGTAAPTPTPTTTPAPGCHGNAECSGSYPYCGPDGNCWSLPCSDVCRDGVSCCGGGYPFCGPDGSCWTQPCATLCGTTCCSPTQQCQANGTCLSPQGTPTPGRP